MSKYSSDSNSRDRTRSNSRYYNRRHRSSSSSTESSRYSRRHHSKNETNKHHKKSKSRRRSNSSSDYSSSRHKHSSRSYRKDESRSKRKHYKRRSSTSSESSGSNSSYSYKKSKSSNKSNGTDKNKIVQSNSTSTVQNKESVVKSPTVELKDQDANWVQNNVYDVMKRENSIEQIKQEGFVFKVFKPSSEHKEEENSKVDCVNVTTLNNEIINSLSVEESTFLISNRERLLNARYKLLTKKERCNNWAKNLFASYKILQDNGEHL